MAVTRSVIIRHTPSEEARTLVRRNEQGDFQANIITADLLGNATTSDDGISSVSAGEGLQLTLSNKVLSASISSLLLDKIENSSTNISINGSNIGSQPTLNLIAGSNLNISGVENTDSIDVTFSLSGDISDAQTLQGNSPSIADNPNTVPVRDTSGNLYASGFIGDGSQLTNISSTAIDTSANYNWTGIHNWSRDVGFSSDTRIDSAGDYRSSRNIFLYNPGRVVASRFEDSLNGAYFLDPSNIGESLSIAGNFNGVTAVLSPTNATDVPLTINLAAAQTANAFEINSDGGINGDLLQVDASGNVTATSFTGDGSDLTDISHSNLTDIGTYSHAEIDVILSDLAPEDAGTLDGQALTIESSSTTKYSGYLSTSGTATYKGSDPAGSNVSYIVRDATFNLLTPNQSTAINKGDSGVLRLYVNGVEIDTFDLAAVFNEGERNSSQSYPAGVSGTSAGGHIDITDVSKYNNFRAYQKLNARLIFTSSDFIEGYNTISLVHDLSTDQTSQTFEIFYDTHTGANPTVSTPTLSISSLTSSKWLSGVRYVSMGDVFHLGVVGNNLFANVYHSLPIIVSGLTGVANINLAPNDSAVTGVSNPPVVNETMTVTDRDLTVNTSSRVTNNARVSCRPRDPYGSYTTVTSASQNILVSTYSDGLAGSSSLVAEYFSDEYYRLPLSHDSDSTASSIVSQWTSSNALSNGNAQCYVNSGGTTHALVYPTVDFSTGYLPSQTADYSGFTGNQQYMRAFEASSNQTSVTLTLIDLAGGLGQLGSGDVNIEIKLPTQTAWLDAIKPYSSGDGVGTDGNGCLSGSVSYSGGDATMTLTFGGKTTGDSGDRMYIRVTLRNSNRTITSILTNW